MRSGSHPRLSQSQKPTGAWQWKNENFRTSIQKLQESHDEIETVRIDMDDELAVPKDFNLNLED
jgi:VCBS repeat-containing protein